MSPSKLNATLLSTQLSLNGLTLHLRPLDESDLDTVHDIERAAHSHPWSRRLFADCLGSRQCCQLICCDQTIVGYFVISAAAGDAELLNITTTPKWQRRGIAQHVLTYLLATLPKFADTLYLEVRESNLAAICLYQNMGFAEVGIRPNYYPSHKGRENAVIMAYASLQ
ncbi:ribosomal protein S18-alanine N-acetyltransferase [Gilvimarinus sp. SDUM040013]|uniref:[Ribosomal protein bS18]-alanine N-acetyltransferase n=1 Tax=Gilvimarinus gilvus TaxID=3058038 RepID=A0ABU4RSW9_9GAMM|nr:ribosomal protein S18-alanine N-acetyltransferase [Gilvimarinus sp. SDUM040013]MDO3388435.1 ribosomal protein S18-alanine N-acetyltransferase [Gilvimarinus sp. SDUM040013]MDX6847985.1 ribosomal protein S18-alanine N-acetyltransferase [Gilvimarinus sp. SDUM040013]